MDFQTAAANVVGVKAWRTNAAEFHNMTEWMSQLACQPMRQTQQIGAVLTCHAFAATKLEWLLYVNRPATL